MAFIFQSPLTFIQSTGLTIDPNNTELFGNVSPSQTITFERVQKWGIVQIVKAFLGIPVIPGR